jgi:hypothetical protein
MRSIQEELAAAGLKAQVLNLDESENGVFLRPHIQNQPCGAPAALAKVITDE